MDRHCRATAYCGRDGRDQTLRLHVRWRSVPTARATGPAGHVFQQIHHVHLHRVVDLHFFDTGAQEKRTLFRQRLVFPAGVRHVVHADDNGIRYCDTIRLTRQMTGRRFF